MEFFRKFSLPIGAHKDVKTELLFPELNKDYDDSGVVVANSEPGDDEGYYDRHVSELRVPTLACFPASPKNNCGGGVLVCPGGGYVCLAQDKEGYDIARYLNSIGFSAFVLNYRLPCAEDGKDRAWGPLRDAQRAIRLIRKRAKEFGLKPDLLGIMGFSAGAHLAATASTLYENNAEKVASLAKISAKPSFTVLIYPVLPMVECFESHEICRNALLGKRPSQKMKELFSPNLQVNAQTPPAFLAQCNDDPVHVENSLLYYHALRQANVPVEMHLYAEGSHGQGMRQKGIPYDFWPETLRNWLVSFVNHHKR